MANLYNKTNSSLTLQDCKVAIVHASYHKEIVDALVEGALEVFAEQQFALDGVLLGRDHLAATPPFSMNPEKNNEVVLVPAPGAFEIPWITQQLLANDTSISGIVTLGAVVRGETPHFDYVCRSVADGILQVSLQTRKPVTFGVLTVDTFTQAKDRSSKENNKGKEAAIALLELLSMRDLLLEQ